MKVYYGLLKTPTPQVPYLGNNCQWLVGATADRAFARLFGWSAPRLTAVTPGLTPLLDLTTGVVLQLDPTTLLTMPAVRWLAWHAHRVTNYAALGAWCTRHEPAALQAALTRCAPGLLLAEQSAAVKIVVARYLVGLACRAEVLAILQAQRSGLQSPGAGSALA